MMSKFEAEEYTRDSYYQGQDFYHGTSRRNAESIISRGIVVDSNLVNSYGNGFYLAFNIIDAVQYSSPI
jgi:Poly(ADP-ribose) polymerase catalytic domain